MNNEPAVRRSCISCNCYIAPFAHELETDKFSTIYFLHQYFPNATRRDMAVFLNQTAKALGSIMTCLSSNRTRLSYYCTYWEPDIYCAWNCLKIVPEVIMLDCRC